MINFQSIRNLITKDLRTYLRTTYPTLEVIPSENNDKKPVYPFLTYKFTTPFVGESLMDNIKEELIASSDARFQYDIKQTKVEQPTMTLSITTTSKDLLQAVGVAIKCQDWFRFVGDDALNNNGIVVVDTDNIQDRRTLIIDDYEQRQGFDITLRVTSEVSKIVSTIESVEVNNKTIAP